MASARRPLVIEYYSAFPRMQIGPTAVGIPDRNNLQNARLRGGAGRTRTNRQRVIEHGWCPTNSPGRTPIQIPEALLFCVIMPGSPRRSYWSISQSRISEDSSFVEKPINSGLFEREHGCPTRWAGRTPPYSITLWWLVRVRPAPPPSRLQTEKSSGRPVGKPRFPQRGFSLGH